MKLWIVTTAYGGSTFPRVFDNEDAAIAALSADDYESIDIRTLNAADPYGEEHRAEEKTLRAKLIEQSRAWKKSGMSKKYRRTEEKEGGE